MGAISLDPEEGKPPMSDTRASGTSANPLGLMSTLTQSDLGRQFALGIGLAIGLAVLAALWFGQQKPEQKVLFSGISDRDSGAIIGALEQLNVPFSFAEGGRAIMVPANKVHDTRARLAAQGLPKSGVAGFELMEKQKLGVSQFHEQINYQRALEGELSQSVAALDSIEAARVHLAIPKPSVFLRDEQKPSASVVIHASGGGTLNAKQVQAIVHLVSSSVAQLSPERVSVIDQNGRLLSNTDNSAANAPDPSQLRYVDELQNLIRRQIETILVPVEGAENIRAAVRADIDFSRTEQAAEIYKPNSGSEPSTIATQQVKESSGSDASGGGGIAGAAANQPAGAAAGGSGTSTSSSKETNTNYMVDKTIRVTQQPVGAIQRLSVAVVLNHKTATGPDGAASKRPHTPEELAQIEKLVKEAMGFKAERGDTLSVTSSGFVDTTPAPVEAPPFYAPFLNLETGISAAKNLGALLLGLFIYMKVIKPLMRRILAASPKPTAQSAGGDIDGANPELRRLEELAGPSSSSATASGAAPVAGQLPAGSTATGGIAKAPTRAIDTENQLQAAKMLATDQPRVVANIIRQWVGDA